LELHPDKTKVVYCKDIHRKQEYETIQFDFLGYTFRPRRSKDRNGRVFVNFTPAISRSAAKSIRQTMRQLAVAVEERQDNRGSGPHVPAGDTRMDQLLLQVLSVCLSTHRESSGSIFSAVGNAEVQKVPSVPLPWGSFEQMHFSFSAAGTDGNVDACQLPEKPFNGRYGGSDGSGKAINRRIAARFVERLRLAKNP
jgi:hypothetical protein